MKQQTAVEFAFDQLASENLLGIYTYNEMVMFENILTQAKAMEKEQIIEAYQQGVTDEYGDALEFGDCTDGEAYYNETFRSRNE